MIMVEEALKRVGLPVKCHVCKTRGFIKPNTDYGGWYKLKVLRSPSKWYCPEEAKAVKQSRHDFDARYNTPEEKIDTTEQAKDELYKLLD